ncbi:MULTISPECIES: RrF2 family transcriptional regulator [Psychrilyobacter]|uniref:Rrf2 family transcriptional regulator n=1 Tax=Psychrilyobacter piezotolerans TaxID=2293438 RepID=A0ABX9KHC6_9FUSO|nr:MULTISPECIES: Rrf2 family transcriptional regulator [Psychrilyobacter]MCS5422736.1 Rrf2 family transcriptional regulator [Psychrilyobacter sp. S5]NDI77986.1 Rrf2 family transcriptional regulator [Psychrilyobacter piezotolerans]RDE61929.1 Rrf2 family transcriptional regulator [Psychrilyobacter sp. S5]REI41155.1 Rrf2 family transcriptional regulator [Psychrilyobacter piezotolerans]
MTTTKKTKYSLRALVYMACNPEKKFSVKEISEKEEISKRYLEQIFLTLKKSGLIISSKGAQGGYLLARSPKEISVADVLDVMENTREAGCCSSYNLETLESVLEKEVWEKMDEKIKELTENISLEDLKEKYNDGGTDIYYI